MKAREVARLPLPSAEDVTLFLSGELLCVGLVHAAQDVSMKLLHGAWPAGAFDELKFPEPIEFVDVGSTVMPPVAHGDAIATLFHRSPPYPDGAMHLALASRSKNEWLSVRQLDPNACGAFAGPFVATQSTTGVEVLNVAGDVRQFDLPIPNFGRMAIDASGVRLAIRSATEISWFDITGDRARQIGAVEWSAGVSALCLQADGAVVANSEDSEGRGLFLFEIGSAPRRLSHGLGRLPVGEQLFTVSKNVVSVRELRTGRAVEQFDVEQNHSGIVFDASNRRLAWRSSSEGVGSVVVAEF